VTTRPTGSPRPASASAEAGAAALIATFYGPRGQLQALFERLDAGETKSLLRHFEPPVAPDSSVVQLALNEPGSAAPAWQALRSRLEDKLDEEPTLRQIWGYTLIYQANLDLDLADDAVLTDLLPATRPFQAATTAAPTPVASAEVIGGMLWLLEVPLQGDGLQAATVHLAIGPSEPENRLVREVLYGPSVNLLMPDLIAHKGYHQIRQYRLDRLHDQYAAQVQALRQTTDG
jgi:hypothetical protein